MCVLEARIVICNLFTLWALRSSYLIGIWKCWFLRGGENRSTWGKTSQRNGDNQQGPTGEQTQPAYGIDAECGAWTVLDLFGLHVLFSNVGHVILIKRTVSIKFHLNSRPSKSHNLSLSSRISFSWRMYKQWKTNIHSHGLKSTLAIYKTLITTRLYLISENIRNQFHKWKGQDNLPKIQQLPSINTEINIFFKARAVNFQLIQSTVKSLNFKHKKKAVNGVKASATTPLRPSKRSN